MAIGFGTFFVAMIVLNISFGQPPVCRDGWSPQSIGTQGACSYHGGLVSRNGWIFWVSAITGGAAVFVLVAWAKYVVRAKERLRLDQTDNLQVPEGYDSKENRDLRAIGFSDDETREIIARRNPKRDP
ncbi:hypothetical protein LP7551_02399 [Roseibium album]|nr:hypothetical protein LP7551_02399 [Roseibium album]